MNNSLTKIAAVAIAALLLVWAGAAWYIGNETAKAQKELEQRRALIGRYDTLKNRWSAKARRAAQRKLETMLRLYGITPKIKKLRTKKLYTFTLGKRNADKILGRILDSDLALEELDVKRIDERHLQVRLGVAI